MAERCDWVLEAAPKDKDRKFYTSVFGGGNDMDTIKTTNASSPDNLETGDLNQSLNRSILDNDDGGFISSNAKVTNPADSEVPEAKDNRSSEASEKTEIAGFGQPTCCDSRNTKYTQEQYLRDKIKWKIIAEENSIKDLKALDAELPSGMTDNFYLSISI